MARIGRGHTRQSLTPGITQTAGAGSSTFGVRIRALGPRPPAVILPLPDQRTQMTIRSATWAARNQKLGWRRRFPGQEMEPSTIHQSGSTTVWGTFERMLGPDPPEVILPLPTLDMMTVKTYYRIAVRNRLSRVRRYPNSYIFAPIIPTVGFTAPPLDVELQAIAERVASQRRQPHWDLFPPQVLAQPPPASALLAFQVFSGRRRRRPLSTILFPPTVLQAFSGPAIYELPIDRLGRRHRRGVLSNLGAPIFYPQTGTVALTGQALENRVGRVRREPFSRLSYVVYPATSAIATLGQAVARRAGDQRRKPHSILAPPVFYPQTGSTSAPLVRTRPRRTTWFLTAVRYPETSKIATTFARVRPRRTRWQLTAIIYPQETPIEVELRAVPAPVDDRERRRTRWFLTAVTYPQTSDVLVTNVRTRPRTTRSFLSPPRALQVFAGPTVALAHQRRRPVRSLQPAPPPATAQTFAGPTVSLVRLRRRPTRFFLTAVSYPATSQIQTRLVRTRPPRTRWFLTAVSYPQVTPLVEQEIAVKTVTDDRRRRAPRSVLRPPIFYPQTGKVAATLARIRPRRTRWYLTAVSYPTTGRVSVTVARNRPRPTRHSLTAVYYPQTTPIEVELRAVVAPIDDRERRRTHSALYPPQFYPVAGVGFSRLVAILNRPRRTHPSLPTVLGAVYPPVAIPPLSRLARTRPRRTIWFLTSVSYPQTGELATSTVRTRPRRTRWFLTAVSYPSTSEIATATVRTRPRRTRWFLTSVVYPAASQIETKLTRTRPRRTRWFLTNVTYAQIGQIRTALARIRPRATRRFLTFVTYPQAGTISVHLTRIRPRATRHALTAVTYPQQTEIFVLLTRARPRPTRHSLTAVQYAQQTPIETRLEAVAAPQDDRRRRLTRWFLTSVSYPQTGRVATKTVRTRPRRTIWFLTAVSYPSTSAIATSLVRIRPPRVRVSLTAVEYPPAAIPENGPRALSRTPLPRRATRSRLFPPTVLRVFLGPLRASTPAARRPRTNSRTLAPVTYPAFGQIATVLTRIRPVRVSSRLEQPATLRAATPIVEHEVVVLLAPRSARRQASVLLLPPAALRIFAAPSVRPVRERPRRTIWILRTPAAVAATAGEPARRIVVLLAPRAHRRPSLVIAPVSPPPAAPVRPAKVELARSRRPHIRSVLAPPTVIGPPPPPPVVSVLLVRSTFQPRRLPAHPRLFPIPPLRLGLPITQGVQVASAVGDGYQEGSTATEGAPSGSGATAGTQAAPVATDGTEAASGATDGSPEGAAGTQGDQASDAVTEGAQEGTIVSDGEQRPIGATEGEQQPGGVTEGDQRSAAGTDGGQMPPAELG